jgi:hypothetical protein
MTAGRPQKADAGTLYSFAHQFYWDFRTLAEGRSRKGFDRELFEKLSAEIRNKELYLTEEQKARIAALAEEEIASGRLQESQKAGWLRNAEDSQLAVLRYHYERLAADKATRQLRVPGEPDVIADLLSADKPEEIKSICDDAYITRSVEVQPNVFRDLKICNWPISIGSMLPSYLSQYAFEFIAARKDPRFPKSNSRPTSRLKQLWFLSRALAGALFGVTTRTAINLVGSMRPEKIFEESRAAKPARTRARRVGARQRSRRTS